VQGTIDFGLQIIKSQSKLISGFSDADWADLLMTEDLREVLPYSWVLILCLGVLGSSLLFQGPAQKRNIKLL
jgi:hypothetical protein